jgi:carboxyl-terminal processing protease
MDLKPEEQNNDELTSTNEVISSDSNEIKNRRLINRVLGFFLAFLLLAASFWSGTYYEKKTINKNASGSDSPIDQLVVYNRDNSYSKSIDFSLYWKAWDLLKAKYTDAKSLSEEKMLYGSIKGMMAATGDPYTTFFDPDENKKFNEEITGNFEGIGAELGIKNGILTIIAPLKDSPSEKAGLRANDKILKVDAKSTLEMSIDEAVSLIRGPKNSEVVLTILREGEEETKDITVIRDVINVKSVEIEFKDNEIALITVSRFGETTDTEFKSAAKEVEKKLARGIIIDLRNDPGGYLDRAVDIASKMLPKDKTVVIEEDNVGKQKKLLTNGGDTMSQFWTVVLLNEGSASASEILAGALRENRENVILVGKQSFGKGSVQEFIDMPEGTAAKITVAKWLTPKGNQINKVGIKPDIEVELTADDYKNNQDPQMDKAIEILKEKIGG